MNFLQTMIEKAKKNKKTIVLPESYDIRVLKAASEVLRQEIANVILIGSEEEIKKAAGDLDISKARIIKPEAFERFDEYADSFFEMRKKKGITVEEARETMKDPLYFGVMLVKMNEADGMVAGAVNSTANTLRPALQILKPHRTKLVSSFFVMSVPNCEYGLDGTFIFSDCGLVENPDADQLSEIALSSAKTFRQLMDAEPVVAMLSYSTYGSAKAN